MIWTLKQREYLENATRRWNIKVGATRSGKTYLDYFVIPKRIRRVAGKDGLILILGNTKGTLQRNVIEPMQSIYGQELVSDIRSDNTSVMFGERVHCLGADNAKHVDRLRGSGAKYIYGDEVVTWNRDVFEMVKSRLDKPYSRFDGTCNPAGPNHWLKEFIESDVDIFHQRYSIYDNDFLDPETVSNMEREHTGVFYDRYILGDWALAEGLIYPMFNHAAHVPLELPDSFDKYYVSMDYGMANPTAMLLWGRKGGKYYCIREYYHSGRDTNTGKTDNDYYTALERLLGDIRPEYIIVDPSALSFINLIRQKQRYTVRRGNNDVVNGIRACCTALQNGMLLFSPQCADTIREMRAYSWDTKAPEDRPIKENDHCMDAMRYFVHTLGIVRGKTGFVGVN